MVRCYDWDVPELQTLDKESSPDNDTLLYLAGQRGYIRAQLFIVIEVPTRLRPNGRVEYTYHRLRNTGVTIEASSADKLWQVLKRIMSAVGDYAHGNSKPKRFNG